MPQAAPSARLIALLRGVEPLLVLTGAGVSRESGIATFRDAGGTWEGVDPAEVATPRAFRDDPERVWRFYEDRRARAAEARPNGAHRAIAALERPGRPFLLATQNVDALHERAGSRELVRLHGSLWRVRCTECGDEREDRQVPLVPFPPVCRCGGPLRPAVVWFGEALPMEAFARAQSAARGATLCLVIGTSSLVEPAASLPILALSSGAYVVEINPEETPLTPLANETLRGGAGVLLPGILEAAGIPTESAA